MKHIKAPFIPEPLPLKYGLSLLGIVFIILIHKRTLIHQFQVQHQHKNVFLLHYRFDTVDNNYYLVLVYCHLSDVGEHDSLQGLLWRGGY